MRRIQIVKKLFFQLADFERVRSHVLQFYESSAQQRNGAHDNLVPVTFPVKEVLPYKQKRLKPLVAIISLVLIVGFVSFFRSRASKRFNRRVSATITDIRVEASSVSSWWTLSAVWSDPQTGQTLIFQSPHIQYPPKHHIGEHITVNYNATKPKHYRMEL